MRSVIIWILLLGYWLYLWSHTHMILRYDALYYSQLGQLLYHQGYGAYFSSGIHSEIIYPSLIAFAMFLADQWGMAYERILGLMQIGFLSAAFFMTDVLLKELRVRTWLRMACLVYFGLSPAILNMAFSMFSEIVALPLCLATVICLIHSWRNLAPRGFILRAAGLASCMIALVLVKGVFEFAFPFLIFPFILRGIKDKRALYFVLSVAVLVLGAIHTYKGFNERGNGQYLVTDRGGWAFYGNTIKRTQPGLLNPKTVMTALSDVPGEGVCRKFFTAQECGFWSFLQADKIGIPRYRAMIDAGVPEGAVDAQLIKESLQAFTRAAGQYFVFWGIEAGKMFFWESTSIGFVEYPSWLKAAYQHESLHNGLRLGVSLLTLMSFLFACWYALSGKNPVLNWILWFVCVYTGFYALFSVVTRYALPIAPLFLVLIAFLSQNFFKGRVRR